MIRVARALASMRTAWASRAWRTRSLCAKPASLSASCCSKACSAPSSSRSRPAEQCEIVVHSFEQLDIAGAVRRRASFRGLVEAQQRHESARLSRRMTSRRLIARLQRCSSVSLVRVMTHLASLGRSRRSRPPTQLRIFDELVAPLQLERSVANSAAVIALARVASGLGAAGADAVRHVTDAREHGGRFRLAAGDDAVDAFDRRSKHRCAARRVGYNGIWRAKRPSRIGIAAIGYGDGYPRATRSGAPVLVGWQRSADRRPRVDGHDRHRYHGPAAGEGRR